MMHICPGPGCEAQVPYEMLACSRHWYQVPRALRNAVYVTWRRGAGAGSAAHLAAIEAAVARMRPLS